MSSKIPIFECKLCKKQISFDPNDPSTYIQDSVAEKSSESFFSTSLRRYKVKHITENRREHYNVVIVDQNNDYRGHKDYYEFIDMGNASYQIEGSPLTKHSKIEYLGLIDFLHKQTLEYVNTSQLKTPNLLTKIDEFYKANYELYAQLPTELVFEYIAKKFYLIKKTDDIFLVLVTSNTDSSESVKTILKKFNDVDLSQNSVSLEILQQVLTIMDFSDVNVEKDKIFEFIEWILKNPILYIPLAIDKDVLADIAQVLSQLPNSFSCKNNEQFLHIFDGTLTVLQYIQTHINEYDCVKQIIDIIERRKLIIRA